LESISRIGTHGVLTGQDRIGWMIISIKITAADQAAKNLAMVFNMNIE
jgi:hypothetical protein